MTELFDRHCPVVKVRRKAVMSHSPPTYVLEFSHARIQLVQTLIFTFLG